MHLCMYATWFVYTCSYWFLQADREDGSAVLTCLFMVTEHLQTHRHPRLLCLAVLSLAIYYWRTICSPIIYEWVVHMRARVFVCVRAR